MTELSDGKEAIGGYDVVAYRTEGRAVRGRSEISAVHDGVTWMFSTAENRDRFLADPSAYVPAHGGDCAFASALGKAPGERPAGEPKLWTVSEGKLYLCSNRVAHHLWRLFYAPSGRIRRALGWTGLLILAVFLGFGLLGRATLPGEGEPGADLGTGADWYGPIMVGADGVALGGYDPVAYFTEGEPRQGDPSIRADWGGATWHFASEEHRALFEAEPERYAPQFGGYCAFGASTGTIVDGSPEVWTIVGDRLFLNANPVARRLMHALPGRLSAAYAAWPGLASQP